MAWQKKLRLSYLIVIELAHKYTRSLIFGFFIGLISSLFFWKIYPFIRVKVLSSIDRIGIVGNYTPSNLPESISQMLSSGLTILSADGTPIHGLSNEWEATNSGKTYVFTINNNVKWHNGKPVTAHDINYNIRGATIIPEGEHKLTIHLQHAYSPFLTLVSKPIFLPGLTGFGPYAVKGITLQGDEITSLLINPVENSSGNAKLYTFYHTEAQAIEAFKLGEVDKLEDMSSSSALLNWGNIEVEEVIKYNRIVSIFFNTQDPILSDKKIRQSLAYAVPNIPEERAWSPIQKTSWAYTDNVKKYIYDEKNVKKMLADTPFASTSAELSIRTFPAYLELAQTIASSWNAFGIKTHISVDNATPDTYQVLISAQDLPPDPDQYPLWHSTQTQTNITNYVNVKIDKLLEDARQESETEARKKLYVDFQRRLVDDVPAVFLYYPKTYTIRRKQ